jgi:hypothetical protein
MHNDDRHEPAKPQVNELQSQCQRHEHDEQIHGMLEVDKWQEAML